MSGIEYSYWIPGVPAWTGYEFSKGRMRLKDSADQWKDTIRKEIAIQGKPDFLIKAVPVMCQIYVFVPRPPKSKKPCPLQAPDTKQYLACAEDAVSKYLISDDCINVIILGVKLFEGTAYPGNELVGQIEPHPPGVHIRLRVLNEWDKLKIDLVKGANRE